MNVTPYLSKFWSTEYDCWALVREFYANEFGISLPVVNIDTNNLVAVAREIGSSPLRVDFRKVEPFDGSIVEMGERLPFHVGIHVDGRILHNHYPGGVVCEPNPPFHIFGHYAPRSLIS